MKFQKINDNVIKCHLTEEDMRVRGVKLEDLLDDHAKADEFLQYILSKARNEVNFVMNGDILNVQMSVLKDGSVSMMISDDQNAAIRAIAEQFKEKLREFSRVLEHAGNTKTSNTPSGPTKDSFNKEQVIKYFVNSGDDGEIVSYDFWSRLSSLDDCIKLAKALSEAKYAVSDLFKYYGEYYLRINLTMSKSDIAKNVFIMSEYSDDVSSDVNDYLMVSEHGEVIIKNVALMELYSVS